MKIGNKYLVNDGKVRRAQTIALREKNETPEKILEEYVKMGGLIQEIEVEKSKKEEKHEKVSEKKAD